MAIAVPIHWFDSLDSQNSRPWFVIDPPDGKVPPFTEEAKQRQAEQAKIRATRGLADSYTDRSPGDRCIAWSIGPARILPTLYGNSVQILQSKDYVVIRYEHVHEARIIPIAGRAAARQHNPAGLVFYYGDALAHWEGDTLVVETTNFQNRSVYRNANAATLKLTERFTRIAKDRIRWAVTVEDPATWTRPWTFAMPLTLNDGEPLMPYECHEGNYGLKNILSAARADEKAGRTAGEE